MRRFLQAGLICVVNDHGALPEIVEDHVSGYIIKNDDVNEFRDVLIALLDNREDLVNPDKELFKIRENAIERAKVFSIQNFVDKLDEVLES